MSSTHTFCEEQNLRHQAELRNLESTLVGAKSVNEELIAEHSAASDLADAVMREQEAVSRAKSLEELLRSTQEKGEMRRQDLEREISVLKVLLCPRRGITSYL